MKRILAAVMVAAFATIWIGCQQSTESTTPVSQNTEATAPDEASDTDAGPSEDASPEYTLVTLNVPNMH